VASLQAELAVSTRLQKRLRVVASQRISKDEREVNRQKRRALLAEQRLANATHMMSDGQTTVKWLRERLKFATNRMTSLFSHLSNVTHLGQAMEKKLAAEATSKATSDRELRSARYAAQLSSTMQAKFKKAQATNSFLAQRLHALDGKNQLLEQKLTSYTKRDYILQEENNLLRGQLTAQKQLLGEERHNWNQEREQLRTHSLTEEANATEMLWNLKHTQSSFLDLQQQVKVLYLRAQQAEQAQQSAELMAHRAHVSLSAALAENQHLKGANPWLQAEVERQRQLQQNSTAGFEQQQAKMNLMSSKMASMQQENQKLQSEYSDALQALVVAQGGQSPQVTHSMAVMSATSLDRPALLQTSTSEREAPGTGESSGLETPVSAATDSLGTSPPAPPPLEGAALPPGDQSGSSNAKSSEPSKLNLQGDSSALAALLAKVAPKQPSGPALRGSISISRA